MATKSKLHSLSARRSSPRPLSGATPEPISTPAIFPRLVPKPNSTPETKKIPRTTPSSSFTPGTLKSVTVSDWWLTKKPNKKGLGIAGFESKYGSEVRLFSSGTISTRHDSTTLETSDGFTVSITGVINRSRSMQNGFSSEVCDRFLLGFPFYWRDYTEEGFVEKEHVASPCLKAKIFGEVFVNLRDLVRPGSEKPDKDCQKSDKDCQKSDKECEKQDKGCEGSDKECCSDEGVKTRGMVRKRQENEASIGKRVRPRSVKKNKGGHFLLEQLL